MLRALGVGRLSEATMSNAGYKSKLVGSPEEAQRLVWVDCEMTGLDVEKDTLLEVVIPQIPCSALYYPPY